MLFAKSRLKIAAANGLEAALIRLKPVAGVPTYTEGMWHDPYSLGWLHGFAATCASLCAIRNKHSITQMESGEALGAGVDRIVPKGRSLEVLKRMVELQRANNAEYRKGYEVAQKICVYSSGLEIDPADPDIDLKGAEEQAQSHVRSGTIKCVDRNVITGVLIDKYFWKQTADQSNSNAQSEIEEFLFRMKGMRDNELGLPAVQVAVRSAKMAAVGIHLHDPRTTSITHPNLLPELVNEVIELQKSGQQALAPGLMVWILTLKAEIAPELRSKAREVWRQVARGFPYARAYVQQILISEHLDIEGFLRVPKGFEND
jgi:hypothetical protein